MMLLNELHQGGIRAILEYDNTVFNSMVVPDGVDVSLVVDHIIYKYGDTPLMVPEPTVLKYYIGRWSLRRLPLWERFKTAIETEYNPLENYDRHETRSTQSSGTSTSGGSVTDQRAADNSNGWENYDKSIPDLESTDTNSGSETSRIHGNIGVTTSQQMLESELDLIPRLDIIDYIADDFRSEFCLSIYY